jgi:hypothetical protein
MEQETQQNPKEARRQLNAIECLIKSETYREMGIQMIEDIDTDKIPNELKVKKYYLQSRYRLYKYKATGDIDELEWANDLLDDAFKKAYTYDLKLSDPKIYYSRAYTKFLLSTHIIDDKRREWLNKKAEKITKKYLSYDPNNSSFLWLKAQLEN